MQALQSYLGRFGSAFLVSAMVPALAFVMIVVFAFNSLYSTGSFPIKFDELTEVGLLVLLLTIILGFTLSSLNTFIHKLFEGYIFLHHFSFLKERNIKRARLIKSEVNRIDKRIQRIKTRLAGVENKQAEKYIKKLKNKQSGLLIEYNRSFPFNEDDILPTKYGNYFKAAEAYPSDRYGIDTVPIWPRLIYVIPKEYYSKLDSKNNELSFLLNCSALSILFASLSFVIGIYEFYRSSIQLGWLYLLYSLPALFVSYVFYRACLLIISEYGDLVRSAFDLFRSELLKKLNLSLPRDLTAETNLWSKISEFINIGNPKGNLKFTYVYRGEKTRRKS
jgi:hypothetical protein